MKQRIKFSLLILVLMFPLPLAWIMHSFDIGIPSNTVAKGELDHNLPFFSEWPVTGEVPKTWLLVLNMPGVCEAICEAEADQWWRLHRALGRDAERLQRVRLITQDQEILPGELSMMWNEESLPEWAPTGALWLVDPRGYVVTAYLPNVDIEDVHYDIEYLLKRNPDQ